MDKLRLYDKKIGKFGFLKNGAGIGENAYEVRYGSFFTKCIFGNKSISVQMKANDNWKS